MKKTDRNFDGLVGHFQKNIYQTPKGKIRLDIIWRDLLETLPHIKSDNALSILDAGAGLGYLAGQLADQGHELVLCDISSDILNEAEKHLQQHHPRATYRLVNSAVQSLAEQVDQSFDLVLFHAVLEWLAEPETVLKQLLQFVRPGGYLSLMYYNRHSLVYRHLLNANFKVLIEGEPRVGERLMPISPLDPPEVTRWLIEAGTEILCESGVRVIYDYLGQAEKQRVEMDMLLEMERRYSRQQPYAGLARYIHVIVRKPG